MKISKIYHYRIPILNLQTEREGLWVETEAGWGEVAPLPGYSKESLSEALEQLHQIKAGHQLKYLPSVEFGLLPLPQEPLSWPVSVLLRGSVAEILKQAEQFAGFTSAKVKVGNLSLKDAIHVVKALKDRFRLRVDVNQKWTLEEALTFCSHFQPEDFDYLEDPLQNEEELSQFPFPLALDFSSSSIIPKAQVWKPTVRGVPLASPNLVLSSVFESGLGLGRIVQLAYFLKLPPVPIGLGTYHSLTEDLLEEPLVFSQGMVHIPVFKPNFKSRYVHELSGV